MTIVDIPEGTQVKYKERTEQVYSVELNDNGTYKITTAANIYDNIHAEEAVIKSGKIRINISSQSPGMFQQSKLFAIGY